jgi:hypothetical protein
MRHCIVHMYITYHTPCLTHLSHLRSLILMLNFDNVSKSSPVLAIACPRRHLRDGLLPNAIVRVTCRGVPRFYYYCLKYFRPVLSQKYAHNYIKSYQYSDKFLHYSLHQMQTKYIDIGKSKVTIATKK